MTALRIILDGDGAWPDLKDRPYSEGEIVGATALPRGTYAGKPSVHLRIETADGRVILAQTTLALFLTAGEAFKARYGDPR